MNIIPSDKHDFETCDLLDKASDDLVSNNIPELLEWLQDSNWPIFGRVVNRISKLDEQLVTPILQILDGDDEVWKYCLIYHLYPSLNECVRENLHSTIVRIANNPTQREKFEEVNYAANRVLSESPLS